MARKATAKRVKLDSSSKRSKPIAEKEESSADGSSSNESLDLNEASDLSEEDDIDAVDAENLSDIEENSEDSDSSGEEQEQDEVKKDKFTTAMNAILGSRVKAHDAANPILIRNKRPAHEIEEAREERKARKAIRAEKAQHQDKARVRDVIPKDPEEAGDVLSNEKKLRKVAQRGVVKLLNAIHSAQSAAIQNVDVSSDKKANTANTELSKEKFLDMIRMS